MFVNSKNNLNIYTPLVLKRYKEVMGYDCNLENPMYFSEKIQWLKLYDVTTGKKYCSDKLNLRKYCKEKLNIDLCPKILKVYNKNEKMDIKDIPEKCVFKCNHGSNWNIIKDSNNFNIEEVQDKLSNWCNINYAFYNNNYEFQYKDIIPKYYIEEFIDIFCEYKFYCFNGKVKLCQVIWYDDQFERGILPVKEWCRHDAIVNQNYDLMLKYLFFVGTRQHEPEYLSKNYKLYYTDDYKTMVNYTEKLAADFKFVRVDFYRSNKDKIYLSEMTFTPSNGFTHFKRISTDYEFGQLLTL